VPDYANGKNCFVAGVNPKKAGEDFEGIPIYASVKDAKKQTGRHGQRDLRAAGGRRRRHLGGGEADLDLAICITEGIPIKDMLEVRNKMKAKEAAGGKKTLLLGPNCPGTITPDEIKIGIMPGHIHRKGRIGVVSRSGTLTYEAVAQLTEIGLGPEQRGGHRRRPDQRPEAHRRDAHVQRRPRHRRGDHDRRDRRPRRGRGRALVQGPHEEADRGLHRRRHRAGRASAWATPAR
jgi:hypothetical protein